MSEQNKTIFERIIETLDKARQYSETSLRAISLDFTLEEQQKMNFFNNVLDIIKKSFENIQNIQFLIDLDLPESEDLKIALAAYNFGIQNPYSTFDVAKIEEKLRNLKDRIIREQNEFYDNIEKRINSSFEEPINNLINYIKKCEQGEETIDANSEAIQAFLSVSSIVPLYKFDVLKLMNIFNKELLEKNKTNTRKPREIVPKISEEQLRELFRKFGYDMDLFNKNYIQKILNYGDLTTVRYALEFLQKETDLKKPIKITKKNEQTVLTFLYRTSIDVIDDIEKIASEYNININKIFERSFTSILSKKSVREDNPSPSTPGYSPESFSSTYAAFKENIQFFKDLGYKISEIFENNSSVFSLNPEKIKKNAADIVKVLNSIKKDELEEPYKNIHQIYPNSITWARGGDVIKSMLLYSELGELDYVLKYPSRLEVEFDRIIPYRIKTAQKLRYPYHRGSQLIGAVTTRPGDNGRNNLYENNPSEKMIFDTKENSYRHIVFDEKLEEEYSKKIDSFNGGDISIEQQSFVDGLEGDNEHFIIAGIKISKPKLLNALAALAEDVTEENFKDILLYCVTYNSLLTDEEFEKIKNYINSGRSL